MNKHFESMKNKAKQYAPEILTVTVSVVAFATYVTYVVKTNDNSIKIPLGRDAANALEDGTLTKFEIEIDGYKITIDQM